MLYVGIALISIVILLFIFTLFIYQGIFGHREEKKAGLKYFSNEEFANIGKTPYSFISDGCQMNGFIYEKNYNSNVKGIVILVHGMGGGHINYMNEICYFASLGYKVISYDNHGTMLSEGKNLNGFEQSVIDLRACILDVRSKIEFVGLKVILYGHSWGAYSVSNVSNYDDIQVDGIVSLAAFNSPSVILTKMIKAQLSPIFVILYPFFWLIEFFKFGKVCNFTSLKGYKKCNCPLLLIHGTKDQLVPISEFRYYRENLKDKRDVEFIELPTKYHRPNISDEGVIYDNSFNIEATRIIKEKGNIKEFYEKADYNLLTKFDDHVMNRIKDFIERI